MVPTEKAIAHVATIDIGCLELCPKPVGAAPRPDGHVIARLTPAHALIVKPFDVPVNRTSIGVEYEYDQGFCALSWKSPRMGFGAKLSTLILRSSQSLPETIKDKCSSVSIRTSISLVPDEIFWGLAQCVTTTSMYSFSPDLLRSSRSGTKSPSGSSKYTSLKNSVRKKAYGRGGKEQGPLVSQ
jgi:hypothetical protein